MTDHPEHPTPKRKRRRATTPPAHPAVAPAGLGQGVQVEATTANAGAAKRRAPRKRGAKRAEAATAGIEIAASSPVQEIDDVQVAAGRGDVGAIEREHTVSEPVPTTAYASAAGASDAGQAATIENDDGQARFVDASSCETGLVGTDLVETAAAGSDTGENGAGEASSSEVSSSESGSGETGPSEAGSGETAPPHDTTAGDDATSDGPAATRRSSGSPPAPPHDPHHRHGWVYAAMGVFVLSLLFGAWGVWTTFFATGEDVGKQDVGALAKHSERLSQEVSTLRRSDQISREANRDLQRTLAERDEEIAGLRADVAFYERFVGATGQRRGLSVHDLEMQLQSGEAWHFVATLTQNLNRGAVNSGRLTLSVEGTRNDRMERLPWARLRKQTNAPGSPYSFKYFQQVEGDVLLPQDFKPLRVIVRLTPADGAEVEQSFTWADTQNRSPAP